VLFSSSGTKLATPPGFQVLEAAKLSGSGSSQIVACVRVEISGDVSRETKGASQTR
jgi:hypothetical protein